ncbi:MAG: SIMPL domain-containing protein [Verrucomicrobia bacterium]|nr:SIMPL domain-containing protein [Verrucomicrobiota bacterium]
MKRFLFLLLFSPVLSFADSGLPDSPYIYVQGRAEIQKAADVVTLRFEVVGRAPDLPKANEEVQTKANKIFTALKERQVNEKDVIAQDLRSEPEFDQEGSSPKRGTIIGYKVTRPFEVKLRDVGIFPKLVDEFLALGGVEFSGIDGSLAKQTELESETWDKAAANARERADKTAKLLRMKVDSVFAVSPVSIPQITSTMFPSDQAAAERVIVTGSNIPTAEEGLSEYRLAPITVTQTVHVIYLISPAQ